MHRVFSHLIAVINLIKSIFIAETRQWLLINDSLFEARSANELNIAITSNVQRSTKRGDSSFISLSGRLHHARLKSNANRGSHVNWRRLVATHIVMADHWLEHCEHFAMTRKFCRKKFIKNRWTLNARYKWKIYIVSLIHVIVIAVKFSSK